MDDWPEEVPIPVDHTLVPEAIRQAVWEIRQLGDNLHRVVTDDGVEWWLLDAEGELIEVFWIE